MGTIFSRVKLSGKHVAALLALMLLSAVTAMLLPTALASMKEGHPEAGTPLFWWVRLELNQRCFRCHGFTDRCDRQLRALTHMAESAELESDITSDTIRLAGGPRAFRVHSPNMAGVAGLEPTNAGVRDRCLDHLATPQYIGRDRATRTPTGGFGDRCSSG